MPSTRRCALALATLALLGACTQAPTAPATHASEAGSQNGLVLGSGNRSDTTSTTPTSSTQGESGNGLVLGSGN